MLRDFQSFFLNKFIILESTSYPGTTQEIIIDYLNKKKFICGKNFFVSYSPERIDPGVNENIIEKIPKIVSGKTEKCSKLIILLYKKIFKKLVVAENIVSAEFSKILENTFRSVNIAFINEMKKISFAMKINLIDAIRIASTKPYGFMPFYPGPGVGGHCIPIDPIYLSWKAKKIGVSLDFIKLSEKINSDNILRINSTVKNELNKIKSKKKSILLLGLAYKKNIDDLRESPTLKIMNYLKKNKIKFFYNDPFIKELKPTRDFKFNLRSKKLTKKLLRNVSSVVLVTDHDCYDYDFILRNSNLIIDCRFKYKKIKVSYKLQKKLKFV